MISISVVIATYERPAVLCETVRLLLQQSFREFEIVIVDQSSSANHDLQELIALNQGRIRYEHLSTPGASRARNLGVELARGPIIVFLDDDMHVYQPDLLEMNLKHYADPAVGGVVGLILQPSDSDAVAATSDAYKVLYASPADQNGVSDIKWAPAGLTSYRASAIRDAGLFDERFDGNALCEDADLSLRVRAREYRLLFDPRIQGLHLGVTFGGCQNRDPRFAENRKRQHLQFATYYVLKNRRVIGVPGVVQDLFRQYRIYCVNRSILREGLGKVLLFQFLYLRSLLVSCYWCWVGPIVRSFEGPLQ